MAEVEIAGAKIKGGKLMMIIPILFSIKIILSRVRSQNPTGNVY